MLEFILGLAGGWVTAAIVWRQKITKLDREVYQAAVERKLSALPPSIKKNGARKWQESLGNGN